LITDKNLNVFSGTFLLLYDFVANISGNQIDVFAKQEVLDCSFLACILLMRCKY